MRIRLTGSSAKGQYDKLMGFIQGEVACWVCGIVAKEHG